MGRLFFSRAAPLLMAGALFVLGGAKPSSSPDKVGDTSYLEGTVSVQRDGQDLDAERTGVYPLQMRRNMWIAEQSERA